MKLHILVTQDDKFITLPSKYINFFVSVICVERKERKEFVKLTDISFCTVILNTEGQIELQGKDEKRQTNVESDDGSTSDEDKEDNGITARDVV